MRATVRGTPEVLLMSSFFTQPSEPRDIRCAALPVPIVFKCNHPADGPATPSASQMGELLHVDGIVDFQVYIFIGLRF